MSLNYTLEKSSKWPILWYVCFTIILKKGRDWQGAVSEEDEEPEDSMFWTPKEVFQEGGSSHLGKRVEFPSSFFFSTFAHFTEDILYML